MRDLLIDFPLALMLLPLAFLLILLVLRLYFYKSRMLNKWSPSSESLAKLMHPRIQSRMRISSFCLVMAWVFATLSLSQPKGNPRYLFTDKLTDEISTIDDVDESGEGQKIQSTLRRKAHDVFILLDVSASMVVEDTRLGTSRLDYAKEIIQELVGSLDGQHVALYAFTSKAQAICPLTVDYLYLRLMLESVGINEGDIAGTDILDALDRINGVMDKSSPQKLRTLVLLTDGGDTYLETLSGSDRDREIQSLTGRLRQSGEKNLRVFTVGLGSKEGEIIPDITFDGQPVRSSLDEGLLRSIAREGRGKYYFANVYSALGLVNDLMQTVSQDSPFITEKELEVSNLRGSAFDETEKLLEYDYYFQYPLIFAIFFLLIGIYLPQTKKVKS